MLLSAVCSIPTTHKTLRDSLKDSPASEYNVTQIVVFFE